MTTADYRAGPKATIMGLGVLQMTQKSAASRISGALADATGRTEDELRLAMTVAVVAAGLIAGLRVLKFLGDLGSHAFSHSRRG